jgi:hypothetical protein
MGAVLGFEYEQNYAEQVRRLFFGDAPGGPVPAGIILANDRQEWAVLRGEIPLQAGNSQAAVAAQFSFVQFTCGPPKERAAVLFGFFVQCTAGFKLGLLATPLATASSLRATSRDLRRASLVTFAGINSQAGDPFGSQPPLSGTPAGGTFMPIPPFVIGNPGNAQLPDALVFVSGAVNTAITVYAWGYERRLRPEEQALD